ncbi:MAG: hypothetical protein Q9219_005297 [cf. Caloplaca sp. 3 TL-2023]
MQYQLPRLDQVEDVEKYKIGGFHPIHLGDTFEDGRYRVLHKLGFGGFSTAWLARDNHLRRLVSLKVVTADASYQQKELQMSQYLDENAKGNPYRENILTILDTFTIQGPNGRHVCYVSQLGGPSIARLYDCPGRTIGSRRLHGPLAHITPRNILLRLKSVDGWDSDDVKNHLEEPVKDKVLTLSGEEPSISAPKYLVQPTSLSSIAPRHISPEIVLIDFGEAFLESSPPSNGVGTPVSYRSPELILKRKASMWSDVWALSCTMFELRSGFPLFESFLNSTQQVLEQILKILGPPPDELWASLKPYDIHQVQFETSGSSLLTEQVSSIGQDDEEPLGDGTSLWLTELPTFNLLENTGTRISKDEINALAGLLQRTLQFHPEERLPVAALLRHKWLLDSI